MSINSSSTITATSITVTLLPSSSSPGNGGSGASVSKGPSALVHEVKRCEALGGELVAFLHWKGDSKRKNLWVPVSQLQLADEADRPAVSKPLITKTALTPVMRESTKIGDFFEDRLRRDRFTATSVYDVHYLCYRFRSWYFAPYHLLNGDFDVTQEDLPDVYIDPFSLTPFKTQREMLDHVQRHCTRFSPPGSIVYEDPATGVSVYEVNGKEHPTYCRNLALVGKSFLECKLVGHDVETYVFYVTCIDEHHLRTGFVAQENARYCVGFYSWEKEDYERNLACIVTIPCFQGRGLGSFMIALSYHMAYSKGFVGTPERPFSALGEAAYHRYWGEQLFLWAQTFLASSNSNNDGSEVIDVDEDTGLRQTTIEQIAHDIKIEEKDVLDMVLQFGLLQRREKGPLMLLPDSTIQRWTAAYRSDSHLSTTGTGGKKLMFRSDPSIFRPHGAGSAAANAGNAPRRTTRSMTAAALAGAAAAATDSSRKLGRDERDEHY